MLKRIYTRMLDSFLQTNRGSSIFYDIASHAASLPKVKKYSKMRNIYTKLIFQGISNNQLIPYSKDQIWPHWIHKENKNDNLNYSASNLPLFQINSAFRNWTNLSFPGQDENAIIDPNGLLTPCGNGWSLDIWLSQNDTLVSPSMLNNVKQTFLDERNPSVNTQFQFNNLEANIQTFFKHYETDENIIFHELAVKNVGTKVENFSIYFAVRPYNPEGVSSVKDIVFLTSNAFVVNDRLGVVFDKKPNNIVCIDYKEGDISKYFQKWEMILKSHCSSHLASGFVEYRVTVDPGKTISLNSKLPIHKSNTKLLGWFNENLSTNKTKLLNQRIKKIQHYVHSKELILCSNDWDQLLLSLTKITLPNSNINHFFNQNVSHLLNFIGKNIYYSGTTLIKEEWLRESLMGLFTLNQLGACKLSETYITNHPIFKSISFNKIKSIKEYDVLGQFIFVIYDIYKFQRKREFLEQCFPFIDAIVKQIQKLRIKKSENSETISLLKASSSFDLNGNKQHYLSDNFWCLAGLRSAGKIAAILGKQDKIDLYKKHTDSLSDALKTYLSVISKKTNKIYIPTSIERAIDPDMIHSLTSVYPLGVFRPQDEFITHSLEIIESLYANDNSTAKITNVSGINIYENCLLAQIYLLRKNDKAFNILDYILKTSESTGSLPNMIHPISKKGGFGDGHFLGSTSSILQLIRSCIVKEDDKSIHLFPFTPEEWFGKSLSVKSLHTHYGLLDISLHYKKENNSYTLNINSHYHTQPIDIKISFRAPIKKVIIDGQTEKQIDLTMAVLPSRIKEVTFFF